MISLPYGNNTSPPPTKKELRREMKRLEGLFSPADAAAETVRIWSRVERMPSFLSSRTVLSYMDIPGEVPTAAFMEKWGSVKRFAIPLVVGDELEFYEYDPLNLGSGYRGIREPLPGAVPVLPSAIDFALVPGVAFSVRDGRLWRLGRGKGFYDRALPDMDCPKVGIYFSFRLVDYLPVESWDQPLDMISG